MARGIEKKYDIIYLSYLRFLCLAERESLIFLHENARLHVGFSEKPVTGRYQKARYHGVVCKCALGLKMRGEHFRLFATNEQF
jgi:hypothetical protein